ncbi:alpha-L-arabinofuranosidase C-terminal domain-containing protein [Alloacidobacterium sp.]|uniref:alpha-L-arabinofuranosidase C-terminal domain-containing protein n=1 Tax=Alloacidobacterium sp. TaxID=2951999 RepID=UPI002D417D0C|nr:alpha-L-arabinofuranosidase C-terminal domain-containing protein [Alloacidobacterium sp.]HYK35594.1 alpha-L-arabinofuranosidase C-terminal domain-containing protein [Alloacidobacterium sp.]
MTRIVPLALVTLLGVSASTMAAAQSIVNQPVPATATIQIDASQSAGAAIPRTIFGSFLEPIGNSTYNGLWAEILQNPSFEAGMWSAGNVGRMLHDDPELGRASSLGLPLPWEPLDPNQGNRYEPRYGNAANSWRSLMIMGVPGEPTGIRQKVYLPVHRTLEYKGSLYARHLDGPSGLTISIRRHDGGDALASAHIDAASDSWTKYSFDLNLPEGKLHRLDPADFVVQVEGDERVEVDEFSLMPADALDGLDPDEVAMAKAMETPLVRFGGNFTSGYHWRDGIGPRDKRVSMLNLAWGIPEYNTFGTDEFLHFCELIGADPQVALNLGSGTPEEAADWVRYIDEHWHKHGGLTWELGNELWGSWNTGWPTLDQLAARTLAYSKAIRAVDPNAVLIATGADPDNYTKWNATQLTNPANTFNYLSTHFVVTNTDVRMPHASTDFITQAAFALPIGLEAKLKEMQQQINSIPAFADKAHIAFTEWLFIGNRPGTPSFRNMGGAIDTAGFFNMLMRNSSIVPISDMTGIMEFAGIWKARSQVFAAPGYYAFRMYSTSHATRPVKVETQAGSYSVQHGVGRIPDISNVPYLDVVAALNDKGDTLNLFCVNRSLDTDIPADIKVAGFTDASTAEIYTLRSASISDGNDEDDPERVAPEKTEGRVDHGAFGHVFPHESVTRIVLHRK